MLKKTVNMSQNGSQLPHSSTYTALEWKQPTAPPFLQVNDLTTSSFQGSVLPTRWNMNDDYNASHSPTDPPGPPGPPYPMPPPMPGPYAPYPGGPVPPYPSPPYPGQPYPGQPYPGGGYPGGYNPGYPPPPPMHQYQRPPPSMMYSHYGPPGGTGMGMAPMYNPQQQPVYIQQQPRQNDSMKNMGLIALATAICCCCCVDGGEDHCDQDCDI